MLSSQIDSVNNRSSPVNIPSDAIKAFLSRKLRLTPYPDALTDKKKLFAGYSCKSKTLECSLHAE